MILTHSLKSFQAVIGKGLSSSSNILWGIMRIDDKVSLVHKTHVL